MLSHPKIATPKEVNTPTRWKKHFLFEYREMDYFLKIFEI